MEEQEPQDQSWGGRILSFPFTDIILLSNPIIFLADECSMAMHIGNANAVMLLFDWKLLAVLPLFRGMTPDGSSYLKTLARKRLWLLFPMRI
jgi:hypothetical protein